MSASVTSAPAVAPAAPRLLEQVAEGARQRGASKPTTRQLVCWVRAFVLFHDKRHPRELGRPAVSRFLEHVARTETEPLVALEGAAAALELLYGVLGMPLGDLPRPRPPRLLDQMSPVLRVRHYSRRTEACYVHWVRQFILYHGKRHPRDRGAGEVQQFLTHLAVDGRVSASTQNQALSALVFLYARRTTAPLYHGEVRSCDVRCRPGSGAVWIAVAAFMRPLPGPINRATTNGTSACRACRTCPNPWAPG